MKIALAFAAVIALSAPTVCQTPAAEVEVSPPNQKGYQRAEIAIANTDALVHTTKNKAFIIAHLGNRESRETNRMRLACVKDLISDFDPQKFVLAEGSRVVGNGRIEIFLGSELTHVALFARNANICTAAWVRRRYQTGRVRY